MLKISIVQTSKCVKEYLNQCQLVKRMLSFHKSIVELEESVKISSKHLLFLIMELRLWEAFIIATALRIYTIGVEVEALVQRAAINR